MDLVLKKLSIRVEWFWKNYSPKIEMRVRKQQLLWIRSKQRFHSRRNWTACCKVRSFRDNFQCKLFSHLGNPFGNFGEPFARSCQPFEKLNNPFSCPMNPFERVSEPFAHSCQPFEKLNNPFSRSMNPFEWVNEPFATRLEAVRFTHLTESRQCTFSRERSHLAVIFWS